MNKIETLLKELCPNGVEWESLGESCEIANSGRKPVKSSLRESGDIPYYGANNIQDYVNGFTHDGDYILIAEDGSASLENYSVQRVKGKFWANNHVHVIRGKDKVINGFLFHYFKYMNFSAYLTGGTRAKLTKGKLIEIKIPIPPLEIQEEIVKILDKFTDYVTELTTELTLRQKQYHYYRDMLLSFEDGEVEWKSLGEVARLKNGKDWKNLQKGTVPVFGSGGHMGKFVATYSYNKPTVLIPRKGSISNLFYIDKPFWNVDTIYYTEINTKFLIPKYFYYVLKNIDLESMATNPTRPSLTQSIIDKIPIPIPSLEAQKKIVEVLDYLFMIINDLENGLPKEIELRKKQYEYYRDKLLSFD